MQIEQNQNLSENIKKDKIIINENKGNTLNKKNTINQETLEVSDTRNQRASNAQQSSSRNQLQSNLIIQNSNVNTVNHLNSVRQFQPVPIQSYPFMSNNQMIPLNAIIVQQYPPPIIISVGTYEPINMICPYCRINVTTLVDTHFNIDLCFCMCFMTYFCLWWIFLFKLCTGESFCCFNATHNCPNCRRTIASHTAKVC